MPNKCQPKRRKRLQYVGPWPSDHRTLSTSLALPVLPSPQLKCENSVGRSDSPNLQSRRTCWSLTETLPFRKRWPWTATMWEPKPENLSVPCCSIASTTLQTLYPWVPPYPWITLTYLDLFPPCDKAGGFLHFFSPPAFANIHGWKHKTLTLTLRGSDQVNHNPCTLYSWC